MNSRFIRILLVFIGVAVGCAAGLFLRHLDSRITTERAAADSLRDRAKVMSVTIAELRAGQIAYVARGQGEGFWMTHVAGLLPSVQKQAADFAASLTTPGAQAAIESAADALENFRALDSRVKDFVISGNSLLAADLIFSDGLESTTTAIAQVTAALNEELQARSADMARMRNRQLASMGGAAGGMLVLIVVLAFTGASPEKTVEPQVSPLPVDPVRFEAPLPKARPAITPRLVNTARVCGEFARVVEPRQLPDLLERTAKVLEASGVIVWLADAAGHELHPAMAHGYPDHAVARMGTIPRDANNAAAAAYRSAELRTVTGGNSTGGAMIAPLVTCDGCIGVLSVETKGGAEKDESSQALASIVAAQLATLVSPPAAASPVKLAAQG
jgi:hypothetical protein